MSAFLQTFKTYGHTIFAISHDNNILSILMALLRSSMINYMNSVHHQKGENYELFNSF